MKINDSKRQIVLQVEMDKTKEQQNGWGGTAAADGLTVTIAAAAAGTATPAATAAVAAVKSAGSITNWNSRFKSVTLAQVLAPLSTQEEPQ